MMTEGKAHLVRKVRFLTKTTGEKKSRRKAKTEQEIACSHSTKDESNLDKLSQIRQVNQEKPKRQENHLNQINGQTEIKPTIHIDEKPTQQIHTDTNRSATEPDIKSPKTSPETGIFNKISSIWTNRNENTASDTSQKDKPKPDIVKSFKKFFKS